MSRSLAVAVLAAALLTLVSFANTSARAAQPAPLKALTIEDLQGTWTVEVTEQRHGKDRFTNSFEGRPAPLKFRIHINGNTWTNDFAPPLALDPPFATKRFTIALEKGGAGARLQLTGMDGPMKGKLRSHGVRLEGDILHVYNESAQPGLQALGGKLPLNGYARLKKLKD